jgi:NAD(P)-dependent dehydrogenase (short-subunit alcohol dehydrogenase family)
MDELAGKVAVITGGASGIGLAIAERLAADGVKLVLADVEQARLDAAVAKLGAAGADVIGVVTDVAKKPSVEALRDAALQRHPAVHLLFNNAGIQVAGRSWETTVGQWEWILGVNLWGVIHGLQAFVPHMIGHGEPGHVVNTASMAGLLSMPYMGAYQVTKHAVVTLTESLAAELKEVAPQLGASVLCPAFVQTNLHQAERNRPDALHDGEGADALTAQFLRDSIKGLIEAGKPTGVIAEAVVQAIRARTLHIITHPEVMPVFEARVQSIRDDMPKR